MMDTALHAAVLDDEARIPPALAFRPCADVGIIDEQPRRVDIVVRKLEPVCNDFEVPQDRVAQQRQAAVLPSAVNLRRAAADSVQHHQ